MKIMACYSSKGGVGKTATAVNLAWWFAARGRSTLLFDLDPQGASSYYFRVRAANRKWGKHFLDTCGDLMEQVRASDYPNLDVLPAHKGFRNADAMMHSADKGRDQLSHVLEGLEAHYDAVVLDCPPTMGPLAEGIFVAADRIMVPVVPTTLAERSYEQLVQFFADKGWKESRLRPFFTMAQVRKTLHRETMHSLRVRHPRFARAFVPHARDVEYMGQHQAPLMAYAPRCVAAQAYHAIFVEHCGKYVRSVA